MSGTRTGINNRSSNIRRRRFCLTLNTPTTVECVAWTTLLLEGDEAPEAKNLTFLIVQTEKGDGTDDTPVGTIHYQAYCEFKKAISWAQVKKIFGDRVHIINSRGSSAANIIYCTKNATRYTGGATCVRGQWGIAKRGGNPTMAAIEIQNGAKLEEIDRNYPALVMMHGAKIEGYIAHAKGPRTEKPKVTILYGLTGCGKSQYCMETFGTDAYWVTPPDSGRVWWGHYMCEDICIFDDFHEKWFPLTHMLRVLDSTPLMVAPKGGQVPFNSGHLVFTSNVDPRDWYSNYDGLKAHKDSLERRIQDFAEIIDCTVETTSFGMGEGYPIRRRRKRTETFKFRDNFGLNFTSAGVGDMDSGNGFNY